MTDCLVFSDVDGTILDHDTYSYEESAEGLALLREMNIPLILVSSKTLAEMKKLHAELRCTAPFVFENGGGICWPAGGGSVEYLGMDAAGLHANKGSIESALGESIRCIADMSVDEITRLTGLSRERSVLARQRTTSLPFIIPSGKTFGAADLAYINGLLAGAGLRITKGGRFYHALSIGSDKGSAVIKIIDFYRKSGNIGMTTVGIGDSENDIELFRAVEIAFVVKKRGGTAIETGLDNVRKTEGVGPHGFTEAMKIVAAMRRAGQNSTEK